MRIRVNVLALGLVFLSLGAASSFAQQPSNSSDNSLGDIARHLKAQKAKELKPAKVFTNDNLPSTSDDVTKLQANPPAKGPDESAAKGSEAPEAHDAPYYRSHLSKLQDQLATDKRELDVLQQKLSQNQVQYYPDPNKELQQEYSREDINKLTADVDAKKQQIADDQRAIDDLHDQLRREGGDPGWLR
ncbi:MAG: hypothetical protein ABSF71_34225 [Terriglobia bacterium]|jgi:chromosome segregation ATPase